VKYGIIGALSEEVRLLTADMAVDRIVEACGCRFFDGALDGKSVTVVCSSVGKVNAAVCTTILIREFGCKAVINVGVAGAMGAGLRPLDVVLSNDVVVYDLDELATKYYPFTRSFTPNPTLLAAAEAACGDTIRHRAGRIATGDQFVAGGEPARLIRETYAPDAVEMEGGAVAQACYLNGVPFLVIRTMSDSADENAAAQYDNFLERAAAQSAQIVRGMLQRL